MPRASRRRFLYLLGDAVQPLWLVAVLCGGEARVFPAELPQRCRLRDCRRLVGQHQRALDERVATGAAQGR